MSKYYYFAAQLPFLKFNEKPFPGKEKFLEEAEKWLQDKDFKALSKIDINDFLTAENDNKALKEYKFFEQALREDLVQVRKKSKIQERNKPLIALKPGALEGNPLEVERKLIFLRWEFIESLEKEHYFDLEFFILYFLKLQILERLFTFDKDKGTIVFDELCEAHL